MNFDRFGEMLAHIHKSIVDGVSHDAAGTKNNDVDSYDEMQDMHDYEDGAYNPIEEQFKWRCIWKQDQAHRGFVASQRAAYVDELRAEAEGKGQEYDYYAVAYERHPSPPPVNYPDDITLDH